MKKRTPVRAPNRDRQFFRRTAVNTKKINVKPPQFRGGTRLQKGDIMLDFYTLFTQLIVAIFVLFFCVVIGLSITLLVQRLLKIDRKSNFTEFIRKKSIERNK